MSNDKTLATVKHGGCVQLGDGLLPCPFCGNGAEFVPYKKNGLTLKCKSMGCISRHQRTLRYGIEWLRTSMAEHWNARALSAQPQYITDAYELGMQDGQKLSAQPSPGGQGVWPFVESPGEFTDRLAAAMQEFDLLGAVRHVLIEKPPALAARQPVGEAVVFQIREVVRGDEDEWFKPTVERRQTWREIPKAHYDVYMSVMGGSGPVGVIGEPLGRVALEVNPYGPRMEVRALYAAPPAQAVDLRQLKRFELFADEGPGLGGMSVDYEETDTGAWVRFDDVKALIDSQAVQS